MACRVFGAGLKGTPVSIPGEVYLHIFDSQGNVPADGSKLDIFFDDDLGRQT